MSQIPKVIFQTSITKQPQYVIDMIKSRSPGWEYRHYTDAEIIQYFIMNPLEEFPFIINQFHRLKGAFKADLFRYYFIYNEGGVFIDSDAMIEDDIENIVKDYEFFTVKSYIPNTVFQGFLGAVPKNRIIYEALKDAYQVNMEQLYQYYHLLCANMYKIIYADNFEFPYTLYTEGNGDSGVAATTNEEGKVILLHHWRTKRIPLPSSSQPLPSPSQTLLQNTVFINLDHRKDRLEHVTKELAKIGIQGERFAAVKTKVGAIGCSMSHIKCLELAKNRGYNQIFICEDDITFLNPEVLMDSIQKFCNDTTIEWDMVLIGGNNVPPYQKVGDYCIRVSNCQTTTGYVVKKHYYDTLINNFRESVSNLIKDPDNKNAYALDMYWKRLQKQDKWYMIFPFTVTQCESYSDIEERTVDYTSLMLDADKKWMFRPR